MFVLFKSIHFIILFILKLFFYTLLIIYKFIIFLIKSILFLFTNKFLRIPTILFTIKILFNIKLSIISTIYFLYLMHNVALYNGIYHNIYNNIIQFFNKFKDNANIKNTLKSLSPNNVILSNISLDNNEKTFNLSHLAITSNGLYNIVSLSYFLGAKYSKENVNEVIYDIYNESENIKNLLMDIIDEDVPLTTLILSPENNIENTINIDTFKLIKQNQLLFVINSSNKLNKSLDIDNIKELIIENKAWLLDKVWSKFTYFFNNNKKIIYFFLLCPIAYYIYMLILTIFYRTITILINEIINIAK